MSERKVYVGSIGTSFRCNFDEDISDATALRIKVIKPSGQVLTWTAVADGTNHCKFIVPDATVLDEPGDWRFQPFVTTPDGEWPGNTASLTVYSLFA